MDIKLSGKLTYISCILFLFILFIRLLTLDSLLQSLDNKHAITNYELSYEILLESSILFFII